MTEKKQATVQQRFMTALKEKMKDFYSVERFAAAVKLKPALIEEIVAGRKQPDHAVMQNIVSGVGSEIDKFLEWGQELIEKQAELEALVVERTQPKPKPAKVVTGDIKMVPAKSLGEIIEMFSAWARDLIRNDPANAVWLEKEIVHWIKLTDPELGKKLEMDKNLF